MSCTFRKMILLLAALLGLARCGFAATVVGSVTLSGADQSSGSVWDAGTVTATFNGVSVSTPYGEFSTPASVASALGALISQNCNMPVYAEGFRRYANPVSEGIERHNFLSHRERVPQSLPVFEQLLPCQWRQRLVSGWRVLFRAQTRVVNLQCRHGSQHMPGYLEFILSGVVPVQYRVLVEY